MTQIRMIYTDILFHAIAPLPFVTVVHEITGNAEIAPTVHPVGRVSFVDLTYHITCPSNPQTCGLRVREFIPWWVILSTQLTHTSWCRNRIEPYYMIQSRLLLCKVLKRRQEKC